MLLMVFSSGPSMERLCECWGLCPSAMELCREPRPSCRLLPWFCQSVCALPRSSVEPNGELGLSDLLSPAVEVALEGRPAKKHSGFRVKGLGQMPLPGWW